MTAGRPPTEPDDAEPGSAPPPAAGPTPGAGPADDPYLAQVMAEIDQEVRRRRADLPARVERELDELFLQHSPMAGRGGDLADALRLVESSAFIDPVVPVASNRPAGTLVKKSLRSMNLWYVGWVAHQVSQFATAVSRALRLVDDRLSALSDRVDSVAVPSPPVLGPGEAGAWWVPAVVEAFGTASGRVLHAPCGSGWLVDELAGKGVDAYGVDARPRLVAEATEGPADLREEDPVAHLGSVASAGLGGAVLTGLLDGMNAGQRARLLETLLDRLAPEAVLVVHSLSPAAWDAEDAPPEVDLAPGRPLRPGTWAHVLADWTVEVHLGPSGRDYLVVARR